ncbi:hypothetical protein EDE08_1217 [Bradyrhizobium sp. R2.2-H]|jgi:Zn finger protein HypA/HybF involved in hydrogenase expression|uniref:hypothetical protein n=1 Tax=unclassified Bradyrhizobium TaxID=2631580 RepID=UPI00104F6E7D|nr:MULTISPECIES: hypothetical protein [unclassified Bradyrhizobium]TCU60486.1 hypothetical protein EDE10_12559 [Bradyrhizobium sp. Y-H1]TCU64721.1 hypothetical protein EDE08_1217 [Bradyrhizobium sp. R2.2-H]
MARFRCRACGQEGEFVYDPKRHECPRCDSPDVQFALGMDEMPEELIDRIVQALSHAEPLDDHPTDED